MSKSQRETYPEVRGLVVGGMVVVGESNGSESNGGSR
jgi:hypothetical protein